MSCRGVRKAAVQMLSSAAHSKASLVDAQLLAVLPQLFQQTVIDPSLIRTVDLGPFKHKIDDGLELRKATFECMDVLLDACPGRLDYHAFLAHLESGLKVCTSVVGGRHLFCWHMPAPMLAGTLCISNRIQTRSGLTVQGCIQHAGVCSVPEKCQQQISSNGRMSVMWI